MIREVYIPSMGLWLAEYPFLDRTHFLDLSLQVRGLLGAVFLRLHGLSRSMVSAGSPCA